MNTLVKMFFLPPSMPEIDLPLPARIVPGVRMKILQACEFFYYSGVLQGFVAGVLVTLLFVPSIRNKAAKGVSHVLERL